MSNYIAGPGFLFQKGDGATPEAFTTVAAAGDITGPGAVLDTHEVTNQSSPGHAKEYIPTTLDGGEVSFPVFFDPTDATHNGTTGLYADLKNRVLRNWKILYPDGTPRWSGSGFVVEFSAKQPVAGVAEAQVKIKVVGPPVMNP